MMADTYVSSNGNAPNNASSSPVVVDPDKSALTPDAVKLVSSDSNGDGMNVHPSPGGAAAAAASTAGRLGVEIPRDDTDDNSYVFVAGNDDDSPVPGHNDNDDDDNKDDNEDPNGSPWESPVDLTIGKLASTSVDHASLDKADGMDALSQDSSINKADDDTDDLPGATRAIHPNGAVGNIDSDPFPASGQDHQDSEVAASVLESAVNGVDSPEPDLAASLDAAESTHVNHEPQEAILVSISGKSSEADVKGYTSTNRQNDDTDDLPATTQVIHQNGTVEDSALHLLVHHEIDSKPSPASGQENEESKVTASVLESGVDIVDSHQPDSAVSLDVTKSSDVYQDPQEDNLSAADVGQSTSTNQQNEITDDVAAATQVVNQNGTVEDSALRQLVHHGIDSRPSPAPGQDNQESGVTASVLESAVDLVDTQKPDSAFSLDVTKSFDVYPEPQEDNLVSISSKSSEADISQSTSPNQQNPKPFDEFVGPQESENAYSDATHSDSQQAGVQLDTKPVTLVERRPVISEQLKSSQFDKSEQRIEKETKTELLSEAEENQQTIVGIGENGLSNLDHGSEAVQSVDEVGMMSSTATATDTVLDHNKDHLPVPSSSDCVQDTKELNEYPDESEKSLELDESSTHSNTLSSASICREKETDTVGKPIESGKKFQEFTREDKFQDGASPLTDANVDAVCDPEIQDLVNVSVQSLDKLPDIPREPETELDASIPAESRVGNTDEVIEPETVIVNSVSENPEGSISSPVSNERLEIMLYEDVNGNDLGKSIDRCATNSITTRTEFELGIADSMEKVLSYQVDDAHDITKVGVECANTHSVPSHAEAKPEVEDMNSSGMDGEDMLCNSALASKFEVSDSSIVTDENVPDSIPEMKDVEEEGDQLPVLDVQSEDKLIGQESENMQKAHSNESSTADALAGQDVAVGLLKRPFQFLIRIPRFDDLKVREQIKHAQLQVDKKTKIRDAFRIEIQKLKANCHGHAAEYEAAVSRARSSKRSVKSKRAEIDSVQVVINKVKNAISVDDIDARIYTMEHMIQHETLPLKEEKHFIREIKQLKQLREQLSSNIGSQDEVQQALNEREEIEERLKILKKELDHLKDDVLKTEAVARAAQKKYEDENGKLKELISQFEEANDIRQSAYHHLQSLRKELFEKNKLFHVYKDTAAAACDLAASRDREALHHLCHNQVETIMDLWNKDNEFRNEYVKCNVRSTVRRLGTLDGRSLGPDEEPPVLASFGVERPDRSISNQTNVSSVMQTPILKQVNQTKPVEDVSTDESNQVKEGEAKHQTAKNGEVAEHTSQNGPLTFSGREISEKEYIPTKEELELARKAEELRKEEYAAKLREQRRLEEKSKALEALERKKRNTEKAHLRAELRAQKEAEQKEKEREKRLRKKERKKASGSEIPDANNIGESTPSSEILTETIKEPEIKDTTLGSAPKKPQKPSLLTKQSKTKSIPPPLRNRSKRKMQQWMWVIITCLLVIFLFVLGNVGFFSNLSNLRPRNNSL